MMCDKLAIVTDFPENEKQSMTEEGVKLLKI
jgi:hypothetical protein